MQLISTRVQHAYCALVFYTFVCAFQLPIRVVFYNKINELFIASPLILLTMYCFPNEITKITAFDLGGKQLYRKSTE